MGNGVSGEISIFAEGELEAELQRLNGDDNMSLKKFVKKSYNDVIQMVIRPPRASYSIDELGPSEFRIPTSIADLSLNGLSINNNSNSSDSGSGKFAKREDFAVLNDRDLKVLCSHWRLYETRESAAPLATPCLIYLHSNLGSRVDALRVRDLALARGFSVLAFDFSGSGHSDGIYVTMGWNEAKDLYAVLEHVEDDATVRDVVVFAHSMGTFPAIVNVASRALAVTDKKLRERLESYMPALLRSANASAVAKPIRGLVLDGAYASMDTLTRELIESVQTEGFNIPTPLLKLASSVVEQSVKKRADVSIDKLRPIEFVRACSVPALFIAGASDRYVAPHHSTQLAAAYAGPAMIRTVEGEHYTLRDESVYAEAVDFLYGARRSVALPQ